MKHRKAFTLIEFLVVIMMATVIIGVVVTFYRAWTSQKPEAIPAEVFNETRR